MTAPNSLCLPGMPGAHGRIEGYLREVLKLEGDEFRLVLLQLKASLTDGTPTTDSFKIPGDQDLIVFGLQGFLRFTALNTEPQAILGFLNLNPSERKYIKAMNCLVQLTDTDRSKNVMDNGDIPLEAITPPWGSPAQLPLESPWIVGANHNVKATFTLQDTTAAIVGNATIYGLLLVGAYIPKDLLKKK